MRRDTENPLILAWLRYQLLFDWLELPFDADSPPGVPWGPGSSHFYEGVVQRGEEGKREKREGEKSGNSFRRFVCLTERRERENLGLKIEGGERKSEITPWPPKAAEKMINAPSPGSLAFSPLSSIKVCSPSVDSILERFFRMSQIAWLLHYFDSKFVL